MHKQSPEILLDINAIKKFKIDIVNKKTDITMREVHYEQDKYTTGLVDPILKFN
jgi:hypothetical protein